MRTSDKGSSKEQPDEEARQRKELECGIQPTAVTEVTEETEEESTQGELDWMQDLDDELIIKEGSPSAAALSQG